MAKNNPRLNPYLLFAIGTALLSAAMLMKSFPLFIFFGVAPLFAIADHGNEHNMWNKIELIGLSIAISFFAWSFFDFSYAVPVLLEAIAIMLVFAAYTFTRRALGARLGLLPLLFFWLALEYLIYTFGSSSKMIFLANALGFAGGWLRWSYLTGAIGGASLWILLANWFLYLGALKNGLRLPWLVVFVIVIAGPIIYSYSLGYLTRAAGWHTANGEWILRTAAWVSVLILLSATVKYNIRKK